MQETFIRVLGHLSLLEQLDRRQRKAWLHRTLKNLFLDRNKVKQREAEFCERLALEMTPYVDPDEGDLDRDKLLALLPESCRELVEKRYVLGMTSREIGQELGIPAATVRSRIHMAIGRLRKKKSKII